MRPKNTIAAERARAEPKPAGRRATSSAADTAAKRERRAAAEPSPPINLEPIHVRDGVVSLNGYGVRIAVDKGHLLLADGIGSNRRAGKFSRATCGIKRLVVRGSAFFITGDALAWLADIGASFLNLGFDGEILAAWSPAGHDDARLRRAQALAPWTGVAFELAQYLIREKVAGQLDLIQRFFQPSQSALAALQVSLAAVDASTTWEELRYAEASAASAYFPTFAAVPLQFAYRDVKRVPEHWHSFGPRVSPISGRTINAANPANALLNYTYAIAENETRTAAITLGLDSGLGLFHTDKPNRDSLALDLIEPVRPHVDAWLLNLLRSKIWTWDDFAEISSGVCRILPSVAHTLSETATYWAKVVAPYAEYVAHALIESQRTVTHPSGLNLAARVSGASYKGTNLATPLTKNNSRAARASIRRAPPRQLPRESTPNACRACGVILENRRRKYCDDCIPATDDRMRKFAAAGLAARKYRAEMGTDPLQTEESRARRTKNLSAAIGALREWERVNGKAFDDTAFRRDVLSKVLELPVTRLEKLTGISRGHWSRVKQGKAQIHPMHWEMLAHLVSVDFHLPRLLADPEHFRRDILPMLGSVESGKMAAATGLSQSFCRRIKRGECLPRPRYWEALATLAGVEFRLEKRSEPLQGDSG